MKGLIVLIFATLSMSSCLQGQISDRQKNINFIFDAMDRNGVNINAPLLYGYFFFDKDQSKLKKLKDELLKEKYKLVRLEEAEEQKFILHVEKVEIHSRASLLERENRLDKLAAKFQVETYDGFDVGNADPSKPLVSESSFKKSLENLPVAEIYKIANDLYDGDENDKAVVAFQKCIDQNYKSDTCFFKQGVSFIGLAQYKAGIERLEKAIAINPKYFKAYFNLGVFCYDSHAFQKSVDYYQIAAKLEPNDDRVFYGLAASQFVLGAFKDAAVNCETALKLNPNNTNAKTLLENLNGKQ